MNRAAIAIMATSFLFLGARTAMAQPNTARIVGFGHSGTGCPAGTVDASISEDAQRIFVGFDQYVAESKLSGLDRKNCQLRVTMQFDPAWSFSIASVDYRGFAGLPAGTRGENVSTYFFAGERPMGDARAKTSLVGPFFENYARRDNVGLMVFSPCGPAEHDLVINNEVRVMGRDAIMTVDSITGQLEVVYNLLWKKCPRP
ncbi:MAG: DUF4360 domain-containing protein [Byssovorax sp.]